MDWTPDPFIRVIKFKLYHEIRCKAWLKLTKLKEHCLLLEEQISQLNDPSNMNVIMREIFFSEETLKNWYDDKREGGNYSYYLIMGHCWPCFVMFIFKRNKGKTFWVPLHMALPLNSLWIVLLECGTCQCGPSSHRSISRVLRKVSRRVSRRLWMPLFMFKVLSGTPGWALCVRVLLF